MRREISLRRPRSQNLKQQKNNYPNSEESNQKQDNHCSYRRRRVVGGFVSIAWRRGGQTQVYDQANHEGVEQG
jgi:hypothetical protein